VLDATFDDILPLATAKMPESMRECHMLLTIWIEGQVWLIGSESVSVESIYTSGLVDW